MPLDEFVEAMIDRDPGRALTMVAHAISIGRDPRTLTEELIGFMRNEFLCLMAPELVQVSGQHIDVLTDQASRVGAASLVRGIELLGSTLSDMRHAPDPRVLLDVAAVQLTADSVAPDLGCAARAPAPARGAGRRGDPGRRPAVRAAAAARVAAPGERCSAVGHESPTTLRRRRRRRRRTRPRPRRCRSVADQPPPESAADVGDRAAPIRR